MTASTQNSYINQAHTNFFNLYGKHLTIETLKKNAIIPFKEHAQFTLLVDTLCRKEKHHAILSADFSTNMFLYFIEALLLHIHQAQVPQQLRHAEIIFLDVESSIFSKIHHTHIEKDFDDLCSHLYSSDQYLIIVLTHLELISRESKHHDYKFLRQQFDKLISHPKCRILISSNPNDAHDYAHIDHRFSVLHINTPNDLDILSILKHQRTELEHYHGVLIPEELLTHAYSLAERYLNSNNTLENALLLLDSSAARASATETSDSSSITQRPVLSTNVMLSVLSGWTQIPASHLHLHKFKINDFTQDLQQRLFGQDAAIEIISHELQQAQAQLKKKNAPLSCFLFAGPAHVGKKTAAIALVEQLFKQLNTLYIVQSSTPANASIIDIKLQRCIDRQYQKLKDVICETPYCTILFENIENMSQLILDNLHEILTTGYLFGADGKQYNFTQSIIILRTRYGANTLTKIASSQLKQTDNNDLDLLQLVINEIHNDNDHDALNYTAEELAEEITPEIIAKIPAVLCQHLRIVPFLPLSKSALEKIIRLKLKILGKQLESVYNIELGYAPEVIRFLTNEATIRQEIDNHIVDIDKVLKQVYFCVEQAILNQAENRNRPNQLFLQLNEAGQLLRCEWLATVAMRHHAT